jgi:hypothetical protein
MPLHIVFLELVIDPRPAHFESEPEHANIMNRPPEIPQPECSIDKRSHPGCSGNDAADCPLGAS